MSDWHLDEMCSCTYCGQPDGVDRECVRCGDSFRACPNCFVVAEINMCPGCQDDAGWHDSDDMWEGHGHA
jgi:hypothetical protein